MNDLSAFEDFINNLDLPDPEAGKPIPVPSEEVDVTSAQLAEYVRALIRSVIERVQHQSPREWGSTLNGLQLLICEEVLQNVTPLPGVLESMSKEEVAMNAGLTYIMLSWLIYDEVAPKLAPPSDNDGDESVSG